MNSPRLEECSRAMMLSGAMYLSRTKYRSRDAWALVADICGVGSTSAVQICRELGIDPFKPFKEFPRPQ